MSFLGGGGNVPFSWEDLPGVSKFNTQKHPTTTSFRSPKPKHLPSSSSSSRKYDILEEQIKMIPPPPPFSFQDPPRRSLSRRFLWKMEEEDPFLEALKECTKSAASNSWRSKLIHFPAGYDIKKKSFGTGGMSLKSLLPKFRKNKSILSCKGSLFDVEENNLMMPKISSSIPDYRLPIPRERVQGLIKLQESLRY